MNPPQTYYEWTKILELLRDSNRDEELIALMKQGTLIWQDGVGQRLVSNLLDLLNYRRDRAIEHFSKNVSHGIDNMTFLNAITGLRTEFIKMTEISDIPAIPEATRKRILDKIMSDATSIQSSLEEYTEAEKTGKLKSMLRNHPINSW